MAYGTVLRSNFHQHILNSARPVAWNSIRLNRTAANLQIEQVSPFASSGSWFTRLRNKCGIGEANRFSLGRASVFHYQACTDKLDPHKFFKHLELDDTLYSFYLVIQLHVWMCQVRSMKEGTEGRILRNEIVERMWQDLDVRLSKIEGAIFSYDEGLLTDDKTLANALWRTLFSKRDVDPKILELTVKYVRTQIGHLRSMGPREWCLDGQFDWAPFPPLTNKTIT